MSKATVPAGLAGDAPEETDDGEDDAGHAFRYQAGQYLYLNCPDISRKQWHPLTISSAPEDDFVHLQIKLSQDQNLHECNEPADRRIYQAPAAPITCFVSRVVRALMNHAVK